MSTTTLGVASASVVPAAEAPRAGARSDFMDDVVCGRIPLPTIPRVVQRLISGLRRPDTSLHDLSAELSRDPVLSARVLRLANTSFYSGRRSLASIHDAVGVIGTNSLQTLVIACGVSSAFVEVPGVNLSQFWLEAAVAAGAAQLLGEPLGVDAGSAHSAGLLLGTGHLILCQAHPSLASAEFTRYRNLRGAALAEREQQVFGVAHRAVGALWVDRLGFPRDVVQAIANSLAPVEDAPEPLASPETQLTAVVQLASVLAAAVSDGDSAELAVERLDAITLRRSGLQTHVRSAAFAQRYALLGELPSLAAA